MLERRDAHAAGLVRRVHPIVQGKEADVPLWEINLGVPPAEDASAPQPGQVLDNHRIDFSPCIIE